LRNRSKSVQLNIEPGKTALSVLLLMFGVMLVLGSMQVGGWGLLLGVPGVFLMASVIDDTLLRPMRRYKARK